MKNTRMISLLVPIISVILAFLIGCIIMAALSANPAVALQALWKGAFGSVRNIGTTLSRSTPLIFTGLCACFAYKCGVFNLGGEGQFIMGSVVCTVIATQCGFTGLPAIIICLIAGAVAGGLWAMIPGVLKVYRGQNEMIISIMMNYIATLFMGVLFTNWLRDGSVPQTIAVPDGTRLTRLFGLRATSAFIIAIAVGLIVYYFLFNTSKGFRLRAVGFNMTAAKFNGFAVEKYFLFSFLISGMIAGLIHSVESLKLAEEIEKRAAQKDIVMDILIEVNMAAEESKFGVKPEDTEALLREIAKMQHIRVRGLMTVAPFVENQEENREVFRQMRELLVDMNGKKIDNIKMDTLSMGMTGDYEVAIEEGATIVRVGTGIFGERYYPNKG